MKPTYKHLATLNTRIETPKRPWPVPRPGDLLRARCTFDRDPLETQPEYAIETMVTTARVWAVEDSAADPEAKLVYFRDAEGRPLPDNIISARPGVTPCWGGVVYWGPDRWPDNAAPAAAVKPTLLARYAERLKRRAEGIAAGLYA